MITSPLTAMTDTARLTAALAGRYAIERELGHGGMATVYLAHDLKHDRDVALKVLRPELAAVLGAERFLQEIRISARLDHPHILTLIDSGESDGYLWYVLPYVRGESLRDKLTREKQLGIEEALAITKQVASALDYAHRQGVIHRDIKPENVLLHEGEAVVADFGIALAVREAGGSRLTESGLSLGTPQYMSPEQATGGRELDARSDVYSLAAVVYEMLAGEPPHSGPTVQAVVAKLLTERPTRIRTVRETVPEGVDNAVARGLAKVPADRFGSAAAFAVALVAPAEPSGGWRGRRKVVAAGLIGAVALLVALGLWSSRRPSQPQERSVAVLYFEDLTHDSTTAYLATGLTEDVANSLGHVEHLLVKSPSAVRQAQHKAPGDPAAIARALGIRYVVEGSLRPIASGLRVSVRLVDRQTEAAVWADTYDRTSSELLNLPVDIARAVGDALTGGLGAKARAAMGERPTRDPTAYDAYLRGNYLYTERSPTDLYRALEEYRRATRLDPHFASAQARIGMCYAQMVDYDWEPAGVTREEAVSRAAAAIDSALARDSSAVDVWTARAYLNEDGEGLVHTARQFAERAVQIDPRSVEANNRLGWIVLDLGEDSAAIVQARRVLELDPGFFVAYMLLSRVARRSGRYQDAEAELDSAVAISPTYSTAYRERARAELLLGEVVTARSSIDSAGADASSSPVYALVLARTGAASPARVWLAQHRQAAPLGRAAVWLALGERARAVTEVKKLAGALQAGRSSDLTRGRGLDWNVRDPELMALRNEPSLQAIAQYVRLR